MDEERRELDELEEDLLEDSDHGSISREQEIEDALLDQRLRDHGLLWDEEEAELGNQEEIQENLEERAAQEHDEASDQDLDSLNDEETVLENPVGLDTQNNPYPSDNPHQDHLPENITRNDSIFSSNTPEFDYQRRISK